MTSVSSQRSGSVSESSINSPSRRLLHMPDWEKVEEDYINSVRNGRHPISFKRKGELWFHCETTNQRLARVSKGHQLVSVLSEDKYFDVGECLDADSISGSEMMNLSRGVPLDSPITSSAAPSRGSRKSTAKDAHNELGRLVNMNDKDAALIASFMSPATKPVMLDPLKGRTDQAIEDGASDMRSLIDFQLNGVSIDVRFKTPLNYGQLVVLMNENNECLCVEKGNHIRIKSKASLLKSDKICFKMVDLRTMSNPGEIRYGMPMWFQAVETPAPGASVDSNFFSSYILGSKIFQLATIATQQLDESWANPKNKAREIIFKREEEVDSDEEYDLRMAEIERQERLAKEAEEFAKLPKAKSRGWGALKKAPVKETIEKVKKTEKKAELKRGVDDEDDQADNKELVGEVCGAAIAVRLAHNENGSNVDVGMVNEVVSKEALSLGLFVPLNAENSKDEALENGSVLCSNRRIYLCQDLYCLANSLGSNYVPWPLHSRDFSHDMQDADGSGSQTVTSQQQAGKQKTIKDNSTKKRGKRQNRERNVDGEYGILRKVVKRGGEYEFNIDRKCVWRICHVDNLSDAHQMTTAELTTMKVMALAKEKLRKSELRRKGGKSYPGSHSADDAPPSSASESKRIPGGESFSLALRKDISMHLLSKESSILEGRREKEQVLKDFVESQVSNWDPAGNSAFPDDVRSMCSQMSFHYSRSLGENKSSMGSQSANGLASDDESRVSGQRSHSDAEAEGARIMLPVGHEQAYAQSQKQILKQKTLGLRSYHYTQYPHFYKSPPKNAPSPLGRGQRALDPLEHSKFTFRKHIPFNAALVSPGEKVLALRQAFDGISRHEINTLSANGGVDDSVERGRGLAGENSSAAEAPKDKHESKVLSYTERSAHSIRRNNGFDDLDGDKGMSEDADLAKRLSIEHKISILAREDDLMWSAVRHRRKVAAAKAIEDSINNMNEEERELMEEQMKAI